MRLILVLALCIVSGLATAAEGAQEPDPIEALMAEVIEDLARNADPGVVATLKERYEEES